MVDELQAANSPLRSTMAISLPMPRYKTGQFFSPRAAFIIKPNANQNIRFTFNRAFSTPANFNFFLDLIQTPNAGGSGFDVKARGNPPKQGWQFNRSCGTGSAFGAYCMKSAYAAQGSFVGASAAAVSHGL